MNRPKHSIEQRIRVSWIFILGFLSFGCIAFLLGHSGDQFSATWGTVKDGMSQEEIRRKLGPPERVLDTEMVGAGGNKLTIWQYRSSVIGRSVFYRVYFDNSGPGGTPVVVKTKRIRGGWEWRLLWPWQHERAVT